MLLKAAHFEPACSAENRSFTLRDPKPYQQEGFQAARAYLDFPSQKGINLRDNLVTILEAILIQLKKNTSAVALMGVQDVPKLISSARLFECVSRTKAGRGKADRPVHSVCTKLLRLLRKDHYSSCDLYPEYSTHHRMYQRNV